MTGGCGKTGYFSLFLSNSKSQNKAIKNPISRRENGVLESGTDETRTRDLRLDRTERFMSTNGGSDSVFER